MNFLNVILIKSDSLVVVALLPLAFFNSNPSEEISVSDTEHK